MSPKSSLPGTGEVPASPVRRAGIFVTAAALVVVGTLGAAGTARAQAQGLIFSEDFRVELPEAVAAISEIMAAQGITPVATNDFGTDPGDLRDYACVIDLQVDFALDPLRLLRYDSYLRTGGSLYLSGEHSAFAFRNDSLSAFINSMGGGPVVADPVSSPFPGPTDIIEPMNPDHPLATTCNSVSELVFDGIANGHWLQLGTGTWVTNAPDYACVGAWDHGTMAGAPAGRLVAGLDINAFATGASGTLDFRVSDRTIPTQNRAWLENLVQYLCRPDATCLCEPRNHGYWHRYCLGVNDIDPGRNGHGNGPGPTHDTPNLPPTLVDKVNAVMLAYGQEGCASLDDGPFSDPMQAALREYATLQLNLLSGYLTGSCPVELHPVVDTEGLRVADAVRLMETLMAGGTEDELKDARWIGEHVNNGEALDLP